MVLVVGHRGCGQEPENTLRSFKRALELGADGIEIDVRLTKDKKPIVIHDRKVNRTTNGRGFVEEMTLKQIKELDAGKGEKVPTLDEVFDLFKKRKMMILVEIKDSDALDAVLKLVKKYKIKDKVILLSFWHSVLKKAKKKMNLKTGASLYGKPVDVISLVKRAKSEAINLNHVFVRKKMIEICHRNGIEVYAWTVNKILDIRKMLRWDADVIISDYPERVLKELARVRF